MATLNELMNAPVRDIQARVSIIYLNPLYEQSVSISSDTTDPISNAEELVDTEGYPTYKWFTFGNNKLDNTYHFAEETYSGDYKTGWWSTLASDANGEFAAPYPGVNLTFNKQDILAFSLYGDKLTHNYPVDFDIYFYDEYDVLQHTLNITNNIEEIYTVQINYTDIAKITIDIKKINLPNTKARLLEASILVIYIYDEADIIGLDILEELSYKQNGVNIGGISANELTLELQNTSNLFDINNPNSPIQDLMLRNKRIEVELGVKSNGGYIWHRAGTYYSTAWKVNPANLSVTTTGLDRLESLRTSEFKTGQLYVDKSLTWLFTTILADSELESYNYNIDSNLDTIIVPFVWLGKMSHREALQELCKASTVLVYVDRDNVIQIKKITPTVDVKFAFNDTQNVFNVIYPSAWNEEINSLSIITHTYEISSLITVGSMTETLTLTPSEKFTLEINFSSDDVSDIQTPAYTKDADIQVNSVDLYCWGAIIEFENIGTSNASITEVTIQGKPLLEINSSIVTASNDTSIATKGINKQSYTHKFIQGISYGQSLANELFTSISNERFDITLDNRGHIGLRLEDKITYYDDKYDITTEYMITKQTTSWFGSLSVVSEHKKIIGG